MSQVWFCSDLHLGHRSIINFSPNRFGFPLSSVREHDAYIRDAILSTVCKRDTTFFLGDVCFKRSLMGFFDEVPGKKVLVRGNHDKFDLGVYRKYFHDIFGIRTYKGFWVSHAPVHPQELRGRRNIHGHNHSNSIEDGRYINLCPEVLGGQVVVNFDDIRSKYNE